uniref:Uncharacterized protein n=1 Tax=Clostridium perfringens TaxID=1502 RepID=K9MEA4_CLOPF|nr:hypothetical protein pNetB-NE10_69 [Clostridium perfringens]
MNASIYLIRPHVSLNSSMPAEVSCFNTNDSSKNNCLIDA